MKNRHLLVAAQTALLLFTVATATRLRAQPTNAYPTAPLINVKVQFVAIEPDPASPHPAQPGASPNVIQTTLASESDFREFLKQRGQRLGAEVMASSNYTTQSRRPFRATITDEGKVAFTTFQTGTGVQPPLPSQQTNSIAFRPAFDVYPKGRTPDAPSVGIELVGNNVDFVGDKSIARPPRQAALGPVNYRVTKFEDSGYAVVNEITDGQSAIIGFLPEKLEIKTTHRLVLFSRIPFVGRLFTYKSTTTGWRDLAAVFTLIILNPDGTPRRTQSERDALPKPAPTEQSQPVEHLAMQTWFPSEAALHLTRHNLSSAR